MKKIILDEHSLWCQNKKKNINKNFAYLDNFCEKNPENEIYFLNNQFYLIQYNKCTVYDKYGFIIECVEATAKNFNLYSNFEVKKSIELKWYLFLYENKDCQINYCYANAANKEYVIITEVKSSEYKFNRELVIENYEKGMKYLEENNMSFHEDYLTSLYELNMQADNDKKCLKNLRHFKDINVNELMWIKQIPEDTKITVYIEYFNGNIEFIKGVAFDTIKHNINVIKKWILHSTLEEIIGHSIF